MTTLKGYALAIFASTGISNPLKLARIEQCMREDIFHSTLDWQTARQFAMGARDAVALLRYMDEYEARVKAYEDQGATRSDAQAAVDAEDMQS